MTFHVYENLTIWDPIFTKNRKKYFSGIFTKILASAKSANLSLFRTAEWVRPRQRTIQMP